MAQPELLAITQLTRRVSSGRVLDGGGEVAAFRRNGSNYPVFAKPIDGKYSLSVIGAALVALVFGLFPDSGTIIALVIAACIATAASAVSLTRLLDRRRPAPVD